ncbi:UNVERIFIED_CONTAM: hypothetical protein GTU68_015670 [Idotea baltica]|nr:hypothetical protein [Idotea baltica]
MRPRELDEILGQDEAIGPNSAFGMILRAKNVAIPSVILWGPPGTGKTSIAQVIAKTSGYRFVRLSGVLDGVAELREAVKKAQDALNYEGKPTLALVDEIHRFNKAQQDAFLPHVELGTLTVIGQTTDNVSFRIRNALLSRLRNCISAFIKSLRGSDPDAALYYMIRALDSGEDPLFISRRMIVFASEDASCDPRALEIAINVDRAVERVGLPEAKISLAQAATYLAACPKSNASYKALRLMEDVVANNPSLEIPKRLRNAPTDLMKQVGNSDGYRYPHDYPDGFVAERYLPVELKDLRVYQPSDRGVEQAISQRLERLNSLIKK